MTLCSGPNSDKSPYAIGIEVKRHRSIEKDLDKLKILMQNKKIMAGACVTVVERGYDNSRASSEKIPFKKTDIYQSIARKYKIAAKDEGNNNFVKWKHIHKELYMGTLNYFHLDYDAMFLILRSVPEGSI